MHGGGLCCFRAPGCTQFSSFLLLPKLKERSSRTASITLMGTTNAGTAFRRQLDFSRKSASCALNAHSWVGPPPSVRYDPGEISTYASLSTSLTLKSKQKATFGGLSGERPKSENAKVNVSVAIRDGTYLLDFHGREFDEEEYETNPSAIVEYLVTGLKRYCEVHVQKMMGLAMPNFVHTRLPSLCSRLWTDLDVIPVVLPENRFTTPNGTPWTSRTLDEQAESMSHKLVRFGFFSRI